MATAAVGGRRRARDGVRALPPADRARRRRPDRGARARRRDRPASPPASCCSRCRSCPCSCGSSAATPSSARASAGRRSPARDALPRRRARAPDAPRVQPRPGAGRADRAVERRVPPGDDGHAAGRVPLRDRARARRDARHRARRGHRRRPPRRGRHRLRGRAHGARARARAVPAAPEPRARSSTRAPTASRSPSGCSTLLEARRRPPRRRRGRPSPRDAPVRLEDVSFAYPARAGLVLDGVDLELAPGRDRRARRAERGGKSTLAALLLAPGGPDERPLARRGVDLAACDPPHGGAGRLGPAAADAVPRNGRRQHPARRRRGDDEACGGRGARGRGRVRRRLPHGYETVVGDGGRPLSAGQGSGSPSRAPFSATRRSSILDEPTANLDPASAALVGEAVERLRARTHRPAHRAPARARTPCRPDRHPRRRPPSSPPGRGMRTLRRLVALAASRAGARPSPSSSARSRSRSASALMATAGYLISRAAEQPPILSLDGHDRRRPFLRARAPARPLPRPARRRTTSRSARSAGSAQASTRASSRSRPRSSRATGAATCSSGWSATSSRCRASTSAASGLRSSRWRSARRPSASRRRSSRGGVVLALGLLVAGVVVPALSGALARPRPDDGEPRRRAERRARRAPARGARARRLRPRGRRARRVRAPTASSRGLRAATRSSAGARRGALARACGLTVVGVLAVSVSAHARARSTACSSRRSRCSRSPRSTRSRRSPPRRAS